MAAHREEFASRGQKYQTSLILSSRLSILHREAVCSSVSSCLRENMVRNSPCEAVRIKSNMFDIFGLARQIAHCTS